MNDSTPNIDMFFEANRVKSFEDWPFQERCLCTPKKMAEAGFYFCGTAQEPDLAICFICRKEMDGWEPNDDPWAEHVIHAPNCQFIMLGKKEYELTVYNILHLRHAQALSQLTKQYEAMKENLLKNSKTSCKKMVKNSKKGY